MISTSAHTSPKSGGCFCPEMHAMAPGRQCDEEGCSQAATGPSILWASTSLAPWYPEGLWVQERAPNAGLRPRQKPASKLTSNHQEKQQDISNPC